MARRAPSPWAPPLARLTVTLLAVALTGAAGGQSLGLPEHARADDEDDGTPTRATGRWRVSGSVPRAEQLRIYQRVTVADGPWALALALERDPGEAGLAEHVAGYLRWQSAGGTRLTAGALRPAVGQGLLLGRGRSVGTPVPRARRDADGPARAAAAEGHAVQGLAVQQQRGPWRLEALAGRLRWDATLDRDGTAVTLREDGDHAAGTAGRHSLAGRAAGLRGAWSRAGLRLGLTGLWLGFDRPVDLRRDTVPHAWHGRRHQGLGADAVLERGRTRWFAAVARGAGRSGAVAGVAGALAAGLRAGVVARAYDPGYFAPLGSAAGTMDNERAVTVRLAWRRLQAWGDVRLRPAGQARSPVPAWRRGLGLDGSLRPAPGWRLEARGQRRIGNLWLGGRPALEATERGRLRLRWQRRDRRLQMTLDGSRYRRQAAADRLQQTGVALSVSGRWGTGHRLGLLLTGHATGGYGSRIYAWEPELPGAVSIRPLYGRGLRMVAVADGRLGPLRFGLRGRLQRRDGGWQPAAGVQLDAAGGMR